LLDMIFGTFFMPGERWPKSYGVHNEAIPRSFLKQFVYPFVRTKR
jgi:sterol desaturase/sphingolipid hydroxylase (fatty acid hydroxylase superfamily)